MDTNVCPYIRIGHTFWQLFGFLYRHLSLTLCPRLWWVVTAGGADTCWDAAQSSLARDPLRRPAPFHVTKLGRKTTTPGAGLPSGSTSPSRNELPTERTSTNSGKPGGAGAPHLPHLSFAGSRCSTCWTHRRRVLLSCLLS